MGFKSLSWLVSGVLGVLTVGLGGCAANRAGFTMIQTPDYSVVVQGQKADLATVWSADSSTNATIKIGDHSVTVDENYVTVDGKFVSRPKFKRMIVEVKNNQLSVTMDGKSFAQLAGQGR